jgi:hypothetical protein
MGNQASLIFNIPFPIDYCLGAHYLIDEAKHTCGYFDTPKRLLVTIKGEGTDRPVRCDMRMIEVLPLLCEVFPRILSNIIAESLGKSFQVMKSCALYRERWCPEKLPPETYRYLEKVLLTWEPGNDQRLLYHQKLIEIAHQLKQMQIHRATLNGFEWEFFEYQGEWQILDPDGSVSMKLRSDDKGKIVCCRNQGRCFTESYWQTMVEMSWLGMKQWRESLEKM